MKAFAKRQQGRHKFSGDVAGGAVRIVHAEIFSHDGIGPGGAFQ